MSLAPQTTKHGHSQIGLYTYRYHRIFAIFDALYQSVFVSGTLAFFMFTVLGLSRDEAKPVSVLLSFFPTVISMSAPLWARGGANANRYWLIAGIFARFLPAFMIIFVTEPWQLIALVTLMSFFGSGIPPMQNTIFGRNYLPSERDKFHGRSKIYFIPILILSNVTMMYFLGLNMNAFRYIFPIAGVFGLISCLVLYRARVRWIPPAVKHSASSNKEGIIARYKSAAALFKRDHNFAIYELSFMFYGCGFMILGSVVPVFYLGGVNRADLSFIQFSLYTIVPFQLMILVSHLWLNGRTGTWAATRVAGTASMCLFVVPLLLIVTSIIGMNELSIGAFIIQGVGMTLLGYAWNFGPIRFAQGNDPKEYVVAHMSLVGVRGLIAYPFLWWLFWVTEDFTIILSVPALLFFLATLTNFMLNRRMKRQGIEA